MGQARRVLIYRLASLGDTLIGLPAMRLIQRAFPNAERIALTSKAPPNGASMRSLLGHTDIVHQYVEYQPGERRPSGLWRLARELRALRCDTLVYLTEPRGGMSVWRDAAFFRLCGISQMIGLPWSNDLQRHRIIGPNGLRETEAARLGRCIAGLGDTHLEDPVSWRLDPPKEAKIEAARLLADLGETVRSGYVMLAVGWRSPAKDWGEDHWAALISAIKHRWPGLAILLTGGEKDAARGARLSALAPESVINMCGASLWLSGALFQQARLTIAADGGAMHLAAAAGSPIVALFSGVSNHGVWFPVGADHQILFQPVPCGGCGLSVCHDHGGLCMRSLTTDMVIDAISRSPAMLTSAPVPAGVP